jgi:glycosyltransferase involved in cell wall biosynthesis
MAGLNRAMKISVITVAYNSAATIGDTLRSVAAQSYPTIEHIVIDGASTDATLEVVRSEGRHVSRVISEADGGIYDAMNKGLRVATGDVVGFLNSDDIYADAGVVDQLAQAMADSTVDAVYGDLVFVSRDDPSHVVRYWQSGPHRPGACTHGWMPPHPTLYLRKSVLDKAGGFDTSYRLQADFELCLRLFEIHRLYAVHLPMTLVRMRMGGATTGSLRNIIRGNMEAARACRQHGFPGGLAFVARKMASRVPQFLFKAPATD